MRLYSDKQSLNCGAETFDAEVETGVKYGVVSFTLQVDRQDNSTVLNDCQHLDFLLQIRTFLRLLEESGDCRPDSFVIFQLQVAAAVRW